MKTRFFYIFSLSTTLFLTSCSGDHDNLLDTEKPAISITEPHDKELIAPGGEIHFDAVFTDNLELASYKIEVHNGFDGHTHSGTKQQEQQDNPWSYNEVYSIAPGKKNFDAHHHIVVPAEINGQPVSEGHYHFGVFVTDAAGNQEQAFLELQIGEGHDHEHEHEHEH